MPQIRPMADMDNPAELSTLCHARREPVFLTKDGCGELVVMSMETYEALLETAVDDAAIAQAEAEYVNGGLLYDARQELSALRRKHFA